MDLPDQARIVIIGGGAIGYRTIDSLRLERRYLAWGTDIGPDYDPYAAGLGFCVALGKGEFIGREALAAIAASGPAERLCCWTLDQPHAVFGGEAILADGRVIGVTTSGGYGHTVGQSIVLGYVPAAEAARATVDIECFGEAVPAHRCVRPLEGSESARSLIEWPYR